MHLTWLMNPLIAYSLAAAGLITSMALFVNIKLEIARNNFLTGEWQAAQKAGQTEIERLRESVRMLEEAPPTRHAGTGINLTKRSQALRMHHRGEPVSSIAAALETPANEIALLLKLNGMMGESVKKAS